MTLKGGRGLRFLFYSHDSFGLGHLSRTLAIARGLLRRFPEGRAAVLSGSPAPHVFVRPRRCRIIPLCPITKDDEGRYVPRDAGRCPEGVHTCRSAEALRAVLEFRPDLFLADHTPAGAHGEILPALRALRRLRPAALTVLGVRDIIDDPAAVRSAFRREETVEVLREFYDTILIYGVRSIFDPIDAYGIPSDIAARTHFTGYLGRNFASGSGRRDDPVLVTAGGGEDSGDLLDLYLRALLREPESALPSVLVAGPLVPERDFRSLQALAGSLPRVRLLRSIPDLQGLMSRASLVVCRAGYNTICEALSLRRCVLVVPRHRFRREQEMRARLLSERGVVEAVLEHPVPPELLLERVRRSLARPAPGPSPMLPMGGVQRTVQVLSELLKDRAAGEHRQAPDLSLTRP
jgi:predicted glycosyltransferase